MKKLIVIPIMLIYLMAMSGIMIQMHYCGQTLASWNVFAKSDGCGSDTCNDEQDKDKSDDCCKDKVIAAKISHEQTIAQAFKLKLSDVVFLFLPGSFAEQPAFAIKPAVAEAPSYQPNAPPGLWQQIPLYKLFSSFTYYS